MSLPLDVVSDSHLSLKRRSRIILLFTGGWISDVVGWGTGVTGRKAVVHRQDVVLEVKSESLNSVLGVYGSSPLFDFNVNPCFLMFTRLLWPMCLHSTLYSTSLRVFWPTRRPLYYVNRFFIHVMSWLNESSGTSGLMCLSLLTKTKGSVWPVCQVPTSEGPLRL